MFSCVTAQREHMRQNYQSMLVASELIGVTNMLEQRSATAGWASHSKYAEVLAWANCRTRWGHIILIKRLHLLGNGQLEEETVETLVLMSGDLMPSETKLKQTVICDNGSVAAKALTHLL